MVFMGFLVGVLMAVFKVVSGVLMVGSGVLRAVFMVFSLSSSFAELVMGVTDFELGVGFG